MKKTKLKKKSILRRKSKQKISVIQRKLWEECKRIIRAKYKNQCYTCGAKGLESSNWHTGHLLAKASVGAYLKYDLRILRPQCYNCNINLGGNGAIFYKRMVEIEGQEYVDKIFADKQLTIKAYDHYLKLLEIYKQL